MSDEKKGVPDAFKDYIKLRSDGWAVRGPMQPSDRETYASVAGFDVDESGGKFLRLGIPTLEEAVELVKEMIARNWKE